MGLMLNKTEEEIDKLREEQFIGHRLRNKLLFLRVFL
jgi:hypothetical protein